MTADAGVQAPLVAVGSWGRLPPAPHRPVLLSDRGRAAVVLGATAPGIAHGMGRSYGDACLNPGGTLWMTRGLDRFIAFDPDRGRLECEAGVLLRDIDRLVRPRGWRLPVTPGTQLVTVGGAIANDVHGKNHHVAGSFGDHVLEVALQRSDGSTVHCGPAQAPDWFAATVGGLGLTGVATTATLQLQRTRGPWIDAESTPFGDVDEFFALADAAEAGWEHTVAWVDCVGAARGRGVFHRGNEAEVQDGVPRPRRRLRVPWSPPFSLLNPLSLRVFNAGLYHLGRLRAGRSRVPVESFNFPLDNVGDWNRLYGPRGFYQYQCVLPHAARGAVAGLLAEIARAGAGSFLAVLKTFGRREAPGLLSFPRHGVTLALDFPDAGPPTQALFARLDAVVAEAGGRLYPAKDARMPRALFEAGYPRLAQFLPFRDPGISSAMSRRLFGA
jgi:FAD/FMN-containing dehydrogenase